jgi:hypothetical protein
LGAEVTGEVEDPGASGESAQDDVGDLAGDDDQAGDGGIGSRIVPIG